MTNLIGKIFDSYEILSLAGKGGMAEVYKGYHASVDRHVAVKVLSRQSTVDLDFTARFQQEARLLAKLDHPHILPIFDYGQVEGIIYIVMPFVESGTLADLLKTSQPDLPQIQRIISQIGDALDYAHSSGVVHRDVKPSNVLIDDRGNCRLTDFGIAKQSRASVKITQTGVSVGTPTYMSPEQIKGESLDGRTDIYSLGVILYQMATGRLPYSGKTPAQVYAMHLHDPLPPPGTVNPELSPAVEAVILKSLAKRREDRYSTAAEMVAALQAALSGTAAPVETTPVANDPEATLNVGRQTVSGPLPGETEFSPEPARGEKAGGGSKRLLLVMGLVVAAVVVGLGLATLIIGTGAPAAAPQAVASPPDAAPVATDVPAPKPTVVVVALATFSPTPRPTSTATPTATPLPATEGRGAADTLPSPSTASPTIEPTIVALPTSIDPWGITGPVTLAPGGEHRFSFRKGDSSATEMNFFVRNANGEIEIYVYNDFDLSTHTGLGNEDFHNRDRDDTTREFRWVAGTIDPTTSYVVKVVNKGPRTISYCINTVRDGICRP